MAKPYSGDITKMIHKEGYVFIAVAVVLTLIFSSIHSAFAWIGGICTVWCIYFFRNPKRIVPNVDSLIVSSADGVVQSVSEEEPPSELNMQEEKMIRVSIFLNIFNVHVNRVPASGRILLLSYNPGKFLNASLDKASKENERQSVLMETKDGTKIVFVQIAGLIAKRIICNLEEGQEVSIGDRYGIIRFGSRMDIYLPLNVNVLVSEGQTCIGGETVIANLSDVEYSSRVFVVK